MKIIKDDGSPIAQIGASGGPLSIVSCSKSWSGPIQNLGFGAVMSRICKTFSQIGPSNIIITIIIIVIIIAIIITITITITIIIMTIIITIL